MVSIALTGKLIPEYGFSHSLESTGYLKCDEKGKREICGATPDLQVWVGEGEHPRHTDIESRNEARNHPKPSNDELKERSAKSANDSTQN